MKAIRTAMLLGSAAGLVLATPAFAAGQAAETEAAPGEIIVTAQRRAESLNDVAMAVQAVDADTLQALRVTDVRDLTAVAPSFTVSQSYQGGADLHPARDRLQHHQPFGHLDCRHLCR